MKPRAFFSPFSFQTYFCFFFIQLFAANEHKTNFLFAICFRTFCAERTRIYGWVHSIRLKRLHGLIVIWHKLMHGFIFMQRIHNEMWSCILNLNFFFFSHSTGFILFVIVCFTTISNFITVCGNVVAIVEKCTRL